MHISSRVKSISESVTLKLNAKAVQLAEGGKQVYNLTAGQLPFRPPSEFVDLLRDELGFLKSFQYSPVPGFPELREKFISQFEKTRGVDLSSVAGEEFDCVVSNGGKHVVTNIMGALLDPGDEVVLLAPYWVSYPEIVKFCKGVPIVVDTSIFDVFIPAIDQIRKAISPRTRAIIVNSPNNPTGVHYSDQWMEEFADLMLEHPHINIISDEIYYELFYFDPRPTYFYQKRPELLKRTVIVDGISKTLASTGLRLGYCIAPKNLTQAISKLQGQTTSGANSLTQRALMNYDFDKSVEFLGPVKTHLRTNSQTLRDKFREANLSKCWYQSVSAFYFMVDFSQTPVMEKYQQSAQDKTDYSVQLCDSLLEEHGVGVVPGSAFGFPNSARLSLVLENKPFGESIDILVKFLLAES